MPGSVKNKIRWGTIFLFVLILISGGFTIFFLVRLREQSKNILKANYESLQYTHEMQKAFDSLSNNRTSLISYFENQLSKQEANITERGEDTETKELRIAFDRFKKGDTAEIKSINLNLLNQSEIQSELEPRLPEP